jgi:hypothetical protein
MLIVDMSAIKLPGEVKQYNLPHECGQPIDVGELPPEMKAGTRQTTTVHHFMALNDHENRVVRFDAE